MIFVSGFAATRRKVKIVMKNNNQTETVVHIEKVLETFGSKRKIAISVINVYAQIAKFEDNPSRINELRILREAIKRANGKKHIDSRYTIMEVGDIRTCFGDDLRNIPETAVILSVR